MLIPTILAFVWISQAAALCAAPWLALQAD
ncbi:hypothetical protein V1294_000938 [Bradyrhizobium sp. AZCC 1678]|jgi:hypothetical protein